MKKSFPFFAVLLILAGALMLLERAGVLDFGWVGLFWTALALLGAAKLVQGFRNPSGEGIVWGTIFFCVGTYQVMSEGGMFDLPGGMLFPAFLVIIGFGFLLALIRRPRDWHLAIPALVLLGLGWAMILAELELLERWQVIDGIRTWWPAGLVLFGVALLLNSGGSREQQLR
jgi:hypothetical protein